MSMQMIIPIPLCLSFLFNLMIFLVQLISAICIQGHILDQ